MAYNKVVLGEDDVLIDLTQDTVKEEDVLKGKIFHKPDGEVAEGTYEPPVIPEPGPDVKPSRLIELGVTSNGVYLPTDSHKITYGDFVMFKQDLSGVDFTKFKNLPYFELFGAYTICVDAEVGLGLFVMYDGTGAVSSLLVAIPGNGFEYRVSAAQWFYLDGTVVNFTWDPVTFILPKSASSYNVTIENIRMLFSDIDCIPQNTTLYFKDAVDYSIVNKYPDARMYYTVKDSGYYDLSTILGSSELFGVRFSYLDDASDTWENCYIFDYAYLFKNPYEMYGPYVVFNYDGEGWYSATHLQNSDGYYVSEFSKCETPSEEIVFNFNVPPLGEDYTWGGYSGCTQNFLSAILGYKADGYDKVTVDVQLHDTVTTGPASFKLGTKYSERKVKDIRDGVPVCPKRVFTPFEVYSATDSIFVLKGGSTPSSSDYPSYSNTTNSIYFKAEYDYSRDTPVRAWLIHFDGGITEYVLYYENNTWFKYSDRVKGMPITDIGDATSDDYNPVDISEYIYTIDLVESCKLVGGINNYDMFEAFLRNVFDNTISAIDSVQLPRLRSLYVTFEPNDGSVMKIVHPDNAYYDVVRVSRPDGLYSENIRKGITIAGVTGTFSGAGVTHTVPLDMSKGNQVIKLEDSDEVMSEVTVLKPSTLIPDNIVEGIDIAGVIGTHKLPHDTYYVTENGNYNISSYSAVDVYVDVESGKFTSIADGTLESISEKQLLNAKKVRNYMFDGFTKLNKVYLPDTITSIGVAAFRNCTSIKELKLSNNLNTINANAFERATIRTTVNIPSSLKEIKDNAFTECYISSVNIFDLASWCEITFSTYSSNPIVSASGYVYVNGELLTVLTIPSTVTSIKNFSFSKCSKITDVTIHDSVTSIGVSALSGCTSLASVTIPDSVTSIGDGAFSGCTSLISVTIGNSVTSIGDYAFSGCSSLMHMHIPDSVESIGEGLFKYCRNLKSVTIGKNVVSIALESFYEADKLENINIPDSVINIGKLAFFRCNALTDIVIGNGVTSIDIDAFRECKNLKSVTIGTNVNTLDYGAFYDCTALETIVYNATNVKDSSALSKPGVFYNGGKNSNGITLKIGSNVKYIPRYLFSKWEYVNITSIEFEEGSTLQSLGEGVFEYCVIKSINIPSSLSNVAKYALQNLYNLEQIYFNASSLNYNESEGIFANAGMESEGVNVIIGRDVVKVPNRLFGSKANVISVYFEEGSICTSIGNSAFRYCLNLKHIRIPNTVQTISTYAFENCEALEYFDLTDYDGISTPFPTLGGAMFSNVAINAGLKIKVRKNTTNLLLDTQGWSNMAHMIVEVEV